MTADSMWKSEMTYNKVNDSFCFIMLTIWLLTKILKQLPKNSIPSSLAHPDFKSTLNDILSENNHCTKKI